MNTESALGWRPITKNFSSGLDFLGLAVPIEGILDAETSGITNATFRVRYFSLVPWYYWKYATRGGKGSAKDQRKFAIGFEMLIAYANIAWLEATGESMNGIIRREYCEKKWKAGASTLPLRGADIGDTPSPTDAALYGPSLRRLNLLGRHGQLQTCRDAGAILAAEVEKTLGRSGTSAPFLDATSVQRSTVKEWANNLSLLTPAPRESELLRALLFASDQFAREEVPPRVYTLLLLLSLAQTSTGPFGADDVERAFARGQALNGSKFVPASPLADPYRRWRILAVLKLLRHACELGFCAVHTHVRDSGSRFASAEQAAEDIVTRTAAKSKGNLQREYRRYLEAYAGAEAPAWEPPGYGAEEMLGHAMAICAWCHAVLRTDSGRSLLDDEAADVGIHLNAHLRGYVEDLDDRLAEPLSTALRWLSVDRGVARHFQVAARKLANHDTYRLIEDEDGARATDSCPIPNIAIRVDAMLSLLSDLGLLKRSTDGYVAHSETERWYKAQMKSIR